MPYDAPYVYVNGRPTSLVDPLGLCGFTDIRGCGSDLRNAGSAFLTDHLDPLLRKVVDPIAGFGDAASFGGTRLIRELIGVNYVVNECSPWYRLGSGAGALATSFGGGGVAARLSGRLASRATAAGSRLLPRLADESGHFAPFAGRSAAKAADEVATDLHHMVPREILRRQLPEHVANNPLVRGRAGAPIGGPCRGTSM